MLDIESYFFTWSTAVGGRAVLPPAAHVYWNSISSRGARWPQLYCLNEEMEFPFPGKDIASLSREDMGVASLYQLGEGNLGFNGMTTVPLGNRKTIPS